MGEVVGLVSFSLLILGTLGLLLNEFVFDWGRTATLVFAAVNVMGLLGLGLARWPRKEHK